MNTKQLELFKIHLKNFRGINKYNIDYKKIDDDNYICIIKSLNISYDFFHYLICAVFENSFKIEKNTYILKIF